MTKPEPSALSPWSFWRVSLARKSEFLSVKQIPTMKKLLFLAFPLLAGALTPDDAKGRLSVAMQIARERNDRALVAEVENTGRQLQAAQREGKTSDLDERLRRLEAELGIDPGGWSMAGQPLFHPTAEMLTKLREFGPQLDAAMRSGEPAPVRKVTAAMLQLLAAQAGVPDARRPGKQPAHSQALDEARATRLFLTALDSEQRRLAPLREGQPIPGQMLRFYGYLLDSLTTIRPFAAKHQADRLPDIDGLSTSLAGILTGLQQPSGLFPFPDLRGRNIRFGDMAERQIRESKAEVRDGWIVTPDPAGGSQFDTGICGSALLRAGRLHGNEAWRKAGLRAADWALAQPCCANFNYNAFSVSLLAHAFQVTGNPSYLDGALRKFRVGIAPGQAPNGRWLDAHNARTVYHHILLRGIADLAAALPPARSRERAEIDQVLAPALQALLDEFDAMGQTVEALTELQTLAHLDPGNTRLRQAMATAAAVIVAQCTDGKRIKMGAQPDQLAAVVRTPPQKT